MKVFTAYKITPEHESLTVESYLKQVLLLSGRQLQKLTRQNGIRLNGKRVFLQKKLESNDRLQVMTLADSGYGVQPEPGPVEILYEDDFLLVLNKPPKQLVHPAGRTTGGTLANFLAYHLQQRGLITTVRAVHRLDRDTSGCVIFAKDARSQSLLEQQLKSRSLKRAYWALVQEPPNPPAGVIDAPIGRHPVLPNRRVVTPDGAPAVTHYRTRGTSAGGIALLELTLDTGRTHQIRVHLAHAGCRLLGDGMYGQRTPLIPRQALHAATVSFRHLAANHTVTVTAPLPCDLTKAMNTALVELQT
ncbi:RluA family pseudouridine synthase|uniref:Pseudouridine synthase n=1 Tax=Dendrosporobacter quercicolus TaxID=146817 RepID=A0A1G9T719_9FIRM|nr:RluA family pseudouridine synthase [Dendrosporobacter quercicolus]NSL48523.1 RluA family pseudouridine synthase [Dendrosporobacter quercicolus DSM 1736]SDM43422.1 23S rRNA pseudouridine1911/1915/1917 synthase [Dendrosporobacter quercicolus]